jgi:O-antigen ligase
MGYFLFILVNAALFIRPAEVFPGLGDVQIYMALILACTAASLVALGRQLTPAALANQPITLCVLGLLPAVVLSHLVHGALWEARNAAVEFGKLVLYYLLLVSQVNTALRLRRFLLCLAFFILVLTVVAVLQYHGAIAIPGLTTLEQQQYNPDTDEWTVLPRLRSTGIFNDPNDLCLALTVGMCIGLYGLGDRRWGPARFLWVLPLVLFGYALVLTRSRGGLIGCLAGVLVLCRARFGWRKTLVLAAVLLPVMLLLFHGRQANIDLSDSEDTAQGRIQLWSTGLQLFRQEPVFGIGYQKYADEAGLMAHNSYVNSFTELGFVGGTLFLGAFYLAGWSLGRVGARPGPVRAAELRRLRPYLLATVVGYAAAMLSLSRAYVVPTYMTLGLAAVYLRLCGAPAWLPSLRFSPALVRRLTCVSVGSLAAVYAFVRVFVRWS